MMIQIKLSINHFTALIAIEKYRGIAVSFVRRSYLLRRDMIIITSLGYATKL